MKKTVFLAVLTLVLFSVFSAFAADHVPVTAVRLSDESIMLPVGKSQTIRTSTEPKNATNKKLIWESSNESVATVYNGKVTAISTGEAVITAKAEDDEKVNASCTVTTFIPIKKIVFSEKIIKLPAGYSQKIIVAPDPEDATYQNYEWSSSNEKIATVDESGVVTAVNNGSTKITAASMDGSKVRASVEIKVMDFDLIFSTIAPQTATYKYSSGKYNQTAKVETGCVSIPEDLNRKINWQRKNAEGNAKFSVTPVRPGADTVTINAGKFRTVINVYVANEMAISEEQFQTYRYFHGLPFSSTYTEAGDYYNSTQSMDKYSLDEKGFGVLPLRYSRDDLFPIKPKSMKLYFYPEVSETSANQTDNIEEYRFSAAKYDFEINGYNDAEKLIKPITEKYGKPLNAVNVEEHINEYVWKTEQTLICFSKKGNASMVLYFEWIPDTETENVTSLAFSAVSKMENTNINKSGPFYVLEALGNGSGVDDNAISLVPKNIADWKDYSYFTFYADSLQKNDSHVVTIIDSSGKVYSEDIASKQDRLKWMRIDVPLSGYAKAIDLSNVAEIRIGEKKTGSYVFYYPGLSR